MDILLNSAYNVEQAHPLQSKRSIPFPSYSSAASHAGFFYTLFHLAATEGGRICGIVALHLSPLHRPNWHALCLGAVALKHICYVPVGVLHPDVEVYCACNDLPHCCGDETRNVVIGHIVQHGGHPLRHCCRSVWYVPGAACVSAKQEMFVCILQLTVTVV